jgi:hypothetical protein
MSATFSSGGRFGGSFTLLRPLGSGGMADVWLAREDDLGREVALKIQHRAADAARNSFLSEAKSLAAVRHPGVIPILRFGVDKATDHPFFAMPVYSETLADRLDREGRLAETAVAELGMSLVPALDALHAVGIAHRDLKPSNVLLDEHGTPVLADIGPMGGGTPAWAAPEQLANNGTSVPPAAADWHALGLLLYRALVGTLPPPRGILPAAVEPPRGTLPLDLHPRPSRGWERLLVALLDPDPATRLTDPDAILRALRRIRYRARWRTGLTHRRRALFLGFAVCVAAALLAVYFADARRPRDYAVSQHAAPIQDTLFTRPFEVGNHGGELQDERDAISTIRDDEKRRAAQLRDAIGNVERPLVRLRSLLDAAMENPAPDADGIVHVPDGAVLFAEDIAGVPVSVIQLDGGTLLLAPPRLFLERLAASWRKSAETLRKTGDPDAPSASVSMSAWSGTTQFLSCPLLIGERGGTLERYDEWNETLFCVTNAIRRATGVERATLECRGFSDLILNRASLDPGLFVTGSGSVADVLPGGRIRNRRWFDPEDPL